MWISRLREDRGRSRKIEEDRGRSRKDRGKIEGRSREDRGKIEGRSRKIEEITFSLVFFVFFGNFRDAGVFRNFWADGLCGWTAFWGQASPLGAEPPHALLP